MYLTTHSLIPYLIQKGILPGSRLVREEWFVSQLDRRKPVLRVATVDGRGWVVKQPSPLEQQHVSMLDREAAFSEMATKVPWARPLKHLMPRFRFYDPGVHALIVANLAHDTGLSHLRRDSAQPEVLGRLCGEALARIHLPAGKCGTASKLLSERLPWILQFNWASPADRDPPSVQHLFTVIRRAPDLIDALGLLRQTWRNDALIHGDAKLDNVIVRTAGRPRIWFIDWAFSSIGDPAWDVGSLVHSSLLLWLHGIPFRREESLSDGLEHAALPLATVQAFAKSLFSAYRNSRALAGGAATDFARRAFLFAGASLVQSAIASARAQEQVTRRQLAAIQMGSHILSDPTSTIHELLGAERTAPSNSEAMP